MVLSFQLRTSGSPIGIGETSSPGSVRFNFTGVQSLKQWPPRTKTLRDLADAISSW
jgi:hypothetical protein